MLATLSRSMPAHQEHWGFEFKWDGIRALAFIEQEGLKLMTRNGHDVTVRYPELAGPHGIARALRGRTAVLDGEIVAFGATGPDFHRLQQRSGVRGGAEAAARAKNNPIIFVLFDLLYLDGRLLTREPYTARRATLESLGLKSDAWQTPPFVPREGDALLAAAGEQRLEGIIAKRLDSHYLPGGRTSEWLKIKIRAGQEAVIGGWMPVKDDDRLGVGALLVGYFENGKLRYAGKVGSGFTNEDRMSLKRLFARHAREESPFVDRVKDRAPHFVDPVLVAALEFHEITPAGQFRQPVFKGLREDKDAREVVREKAVEGELNRQGRQDRQGKMASKK